jgi:tellurite resistance protein
LAVQIEEESVLTERLHELASQALRSSKEVPEHQAVVELLVLMAYADGNVSTDELEALDSFDASHAGWDKGAFSIQQYLPIAVAEVRRASAEPDGADRLMRAACERIVDPDVRREAVDACGAVAAIGGVDPSESALLARIEQSLR